MKKREEEACCGVENIIKDGKRSDMRLREPEPAEVEVCIPP